MFDLFGLEKNHKIAYGDDVVLLTTVYDVAMLGMVRGLLEDEGIPYLIHERATGSAMRIMTGFSMCGTDIFVPKEAEETARDLITGLNLDGGSGEDVQILSDDETQAQAQDGRDTDGEDGLTQ